MATDVTRDRENLKLALSELLEEEFAFSRVRRIFEMSDGDDQHVLDSLPPRTLSPGYYRWAEYLLWLEARGAVVDWGTLAACEMEGLVALSQARREWESKHPACPCGARQESRFAASCPSCGIEFKQRGAA